MTDGDTVSLLFNRFFSHLIGGYTIDMSKSNQTVHGFLTFKLIYVLVVPRLFSGSTEDFTPLHPKCLMWKALNYPVATRKSLRFQLTMTCNV